MNQFSAIAFLGALAIFMYGIRLSRAGVQLLAGEKLRKLVASLTENRFAALLIGIVATLILQSSTATTVMLVGFASSGIITLTQAMGVILGADIGTTLVVILLSIREITNYALLMLVSGVALDMISQRKRTRYLSMVIMGFGFVFLGMHTMVETTTPLRESSLLAQIFSVVGERPAYGFFAAILFTALVQNSATTLGLVIALCFVGILNLGEAIPIVLGANVGTSITPLINSIGGGTPAKRVALAHLFFKLTGALVAMLFLGSYTALITRFCGLVAGLHDNLPSQVAVAHVLFNLALSLFFLPFIGPGAKLLHRLVPDPFRSEVKPFGPKYLEPSSLETPALAFANAKREILRMGEIAQEMFQNTIKVFKTDERELMDAIESEDDKVDILDREVKFYLAKISQESLTPGQARMQLNLVAITADLEEICDIINKNILELAQKKIDRVLGFSAEGWKEIQEFHTMIVENFHLTLSSMTADDESIARKVLRHEHHLLEVEDRYRQAHLQRLHKGLKEAFETSSIHLDLLSNFQRINAKLAAISRAAFPGKELET